jgi:hypothetical protein
MASGGRTSLNRRICSSSILLTLAIFLAVYSCASLREWINGRDNFSRTYAVDFMSFHPRLNSALQDYAKNHKGNSFRVALLRNDAVIIQGFYKREQEQDRLPATITAKPASPGRTRMEIKISSSDSKIYSQNLKEFARNLFQIIEKGTGVWPEE